MRKILFLIAACCVLCLTIFVFLEGIGIFKINGIRDIIKQDNELESKVKDLDKCVNVDYKNALNKLDNTYKLLKNSKSEYNQQLIISSLNKRSYASQTETYDIDYLLTRIGNYAKDEKVIIKTNIVPSEAMQDYYNMNFMVLGTYLYTANFIYDIESDSRLGFKIDNFKMVPYSGSKYQGIIDVVCTFKCKDIPINSITLENDDFMTRDMFDINKIEESFDKDELGSDSSNSVNVEDPGMVNEQ